jgi:hypothetical protein
VRGCRRARIEHDGGVVMRERSEHEGRSFSIDITVGRLIEARVFALRTVADADAYSTALVEQVRRIPFGSPVLLADHRPVAIYPQPVTERLVELFRQMNTRLARVAIIASRSNATLAMQIERIVREANDARRRVTYVPADAAAHIRPALDGPEIARVDAFLAEWSPG